MWSNDADLKRLDPAALNMLYTCLVYATDVQLPGATYIRAMPVLGNPSKGWWQVHTHLKPRMQTRTGPMVIVACPQDFSWLVQPRLEGTRMA